MRYRYYFQSGVKLMQSLRRFSDDPSKTFRDKGLSEENRYFLKKTEEELKRLRKQLALLSTFQDKLQSQLDQTHRALENIGKNNSAGK